MPLFSSFQSLPLRLARLVLSWMVVGALSLVLVGCGDRHEVRQYTISGKVPDVLRTTDRMLAAIIPQPKEVWFIKAVGPAEAIATAESDIRKFVQGLVFDANGPDLSKLPSSWNRGGKKPMRYATLLIDTPEAQLDVSISQLPISGTWDEQVSLNVNRWRGQMKLAPSEEKWAGGKPIEVASATEQGAVWIDLTGEMGSGPSMTPPMASGAGSFSGLADNSESPEQSPTQSSNTDEANSEGSSGLVYKVPTGWRPGKQGAMRLAAFNIGDESQVAELTIIQAGGDLRGNVARWLGQVRGDSPPDDVVDAAMKAGETVTVSGRESKRYLLDAGDKGNATSAIDATIVPMEGGMSLFIKATGPPDTIRQERDRIGEFIGSLEIP